MKNHVATRRDRALAQIPLALTVNSSLGTSNGTLYTTIPTVTLSGFSHAIDTRKVFVAGSQATWDAFTALWTHALALQPGINRVLVESRDSNDVTFAQTNLDIWYDDGSMQTVSGALATDTTWSPSAGPWPLTRVRRCRPRT